MSYIRCKISREASLMYYVLDMTTTSSYAQLHYAKRGKKYIHENIFFRRYIFLFIFWWWIIFYFIVKFLVIHFLILPFQREKNSWIALKVDLIFLRREMWGMWLYILYIYICIINQVYYYTHTNFSTLHLFLFFRKLPFALFAILHVSYII